MKQTKPTLRMMHQQSRYGLGDQQVHNRSPATKILTSPPPYLFLPSEKQHHPHSTTGNKLTRRSIPNGACGWYYIMQLMTRHVADELVNFQFEDNITDG